MEINSKEKMEQEFNPKFEIQSKHNDAISHCIVFANQQLLITIGMEGELSLYRRNELKQYEHMSSNKAFVCPIIDYDLIEQGNSWRLLLVSFDNHVAACRIVDKSAIVIYQYFHYEDGNENISSCVWGHLQNEVILSGDQGHIFVMDINSKSKLRQIQIEETQSKLLRCGKNNIYLATKTEISKLIFEEQIKLIVLLSESYFELKIEIIDVAITSRQFKNFLVLLTKEHIYFFHLENLNVRPQMFALKEKIEMGKLGWGKDENEIGVYTALRYGSSLAAFQCNLSGLWKKK